MKNKIEEDISDEGLLDEDLSSVESNIVKPPRVFVIIFKVLAIMGLMGLLLTLMPLFKEILGVTGLIPDFGEIDTFFKWTNVALLLMLLMGLIFFWGMFLLRKWIIPVLFVNAVFSILSIIFIIIDGCIHNDTFSLIFSNFFQLELLVPIAYAVFIFRYRRYFNGSYKSLVPQVLILLVMLPFLVGTSVKYLFTDLRVVIDDDLTIGEAPYDVSAVENAQVLLESVYNDRYITDDIDLYLEGRDWNQKEVDEILVKNRTVLETSREASALPYYFCPHYTGPGTPDTLLCPLNSLRDVSRIINISALDLALKGEYQKALDESLVSIQIGKLMLQAHRLTMIDYLVALSLQNNGLKTIKFIISEYDIPLEMRLETLGVLEEYLQNNEGLKTALLGGYEFFEKALDTRFLFYGLEDSNYIFHPNRLKSDYADFIRFQLGLADEKCEDIDEKVKEYHEGLDLWSPENELIKSLKPNAIGEIFKSTQIESELNTIDRRCELEETFNEVRDLLVESESVTVEEETL